VSASGLRQFYEDEYQKDVTSILDKNIIITNIINVLNIKTISELARAKGLTQSDLARMAGVSRQGVSLWFKKEKEIQIDLKARHLWSLAQALGLSMEDLAKPLPLCGTEEEKIVETELLWDRLYPSLVQFVVALIRGENRALGRLVQVYGLFRAARTIGRRIFQKFPEYKKYIEPQQRKQWEAIWNLQKNLGLI